MNYYFPWDGEFMTIEQLYKSAKELGYENFEILIGFKDKNINKKKIEPNEVFFCTDKKYCSITCNKIAIKLEMLKNRV